MNASYAPARSPRAVAAIAAPIAAPTCACTSATSAGAISGSISGGSLSTILRTRFGRAFASSSTMSVLDEWPTTVAGPVPSASSRAAACAACAAIVTRAVGGGPSA